jgi:diguanylate cyclase (GGDEF)-like protein
MLDNGKRQMRGRRLLQLTVGVVVVGAVVFGIGRWTRSAASQAVDNMLADRLRQSVPQLTAALDSARTRALIVATDPAVQRLLADGDAAGLSARATRDLRFDVHGRTIAGRIDRGALPVSVSVAADGTIAGSVVVGASAPAPGFPVIVGLGDRVVAGPGTGGRLSFADGRAIYADLGGKRYRALGLTLPERGRNWFIATAVPASTVVARVASARERAAAACGAALVAAGAAFLLFRDARRRRARAKAATESAASLAMVGDALAATHEPQVLLPVILRAFVEASGASSGRLLDSGREIERMGAPSPVDAPPLVVDLGRYGSDSKPVIELYGLASESETLVESLAVQARTALENAYLHRVVEQQASTDELTQLANRRRFMEALQRERRRADRFGGPLAVVLADLDDFKLVNDGFGHQTGDEVLVAFADLVRSELRDVDLAARLGGEEFAILLPETDLDGAAALAERIRAKLSEHRLETGGSGPGLRVTASFGVAAHPAGGPGADLLLVSDVALYRAKRLGKNRVIPLADPPQ